MLSIFPNLLSYNQLSPFLIRITIGIIMVYWAYSSFRTGDRDVKKMPIKVAEGMAGLLLIIGLFTQVAALIVSIDLLIRIFDKIMKKSFLTNGVNYYFIMLIMTISLLFIGAGLFAIDLPL